MGFLCGMREDINLLFVVITQEFIENERIAANFKISAHSHNIEERFNEL